MKRRHTAPTEMGAIQSANAVGLRYVTDGEPGIKRVKAGQGYRYVDPRGRTIRDPVHLKRIRSLAIPPAWTDVWVCVQQDGHLQATGRDTKRRKQFRYHPLWRAVRDATKYDRMIEFGEALPRIRRRLVRDIARQGLCREKVLATIVRLMDLTFIRVGNAEYARQNKSYGLTTMKDQHATVHGECIEFSFRGKSGKYHAVKIENPSLARIVKRCQDIPGQDLFQWVSNDGRRHDVTSGDVNDYLREISGADFTAKEFRTWAGTVLAARALKKAAEFETQSQAKRNIKRAVDHVAEKLGNTPAVCRKCYVHPFVFDGYMRGALLHNGEPAPAKTRRTKRASSAPSAGLNDDEREVLQFLRCCRRQEQRHVREAKTRLAGVPRAWRPHLVRGMRVGHR